MSGRPVLRQQALRCSGKSHHQPLSHAARSFISVDNGLPNDPTTNNPVRLWTGSRSVQQCVVRSLR